MRHQLKNVLLLVLFAAVCMGCDADDGGDPNNNPPVILDGFDGGNMPSPCEGIQVMPGGSCNIDPGGFCPTTVMCACEPTTRVIACECVNGSWNCPENCANEQPPCPVEMPDVVDASDAGDMTANDTGQMNDVPGDTTPSDTSTSDTGTADTGMADTGTADTGTDDTQMPTDTGTPQDTSTMDAGSDDTQMPMDTSGTSDSGM